MMAKTEIYEASVTWTGGHRGHLRLGNGPEMDFSAPPGSHGEPGVLTPEDAFVGSVAMCVSLMFLWGAERHKLDLVSFDCPAAGTKRIELDRTEIFSRVVLKPRIVLRGAGADPAAVERRARLALESARKYSLIAASIKSELVIEPEIIITAHEKKLS